MSERGRVPRLAVIGGGQAAKALIFRIAEAAAAGRINWSGVEIVVYERGGEFGTGLAWSRRFALNEHVSSLASPQPRVQYGDDQMRQFAASVALLAEFGIRLLLVPFCEIVSLEPVAMDWRLQPAEGPPERAGVVVLATGHWDDPERIGSDALQPWPARALQESALAGSGRVLVVGAGLTGVDAVVTLAVGAGRFETTASGRYVYHARQPLAITLVSRTGCLPGVWGATPPELPDLARIVSAQLTALCVEQGRLPLGPVLDVLAAAAHERDAWCRGFAAPGISLDRRIAAIRTCEARRAADPITALEQDLAAVSPCDGPIAATTLRQVPAQAVLLALLPVISESFHRLDADDTAAFRTCLRGPYFRRAMPMGLDPALRLSALAEAGHLRVRRLDAGLPLRQSDGNWVLPHRNSPAETFEHLVDAIGQTDDLATRKDRLWSRLAGDGLVRPANRMRRDGTWTAIGGVNVDPRTRRVRSDRAVGPLYAMGTLTLGTFVDSQGIGHLLRDAARIVADLEVQGDLARHRAIADGAPVMVSVS